MEQKTEASQAVAPWPDYNGNEIHHGDRLVHPDGAIRAKLRFNGQWQHVAYPAIIGQWGDAIVGEDAKRMLPAGCRLEMRDGCCENPTHWMPLPAAPTIPAIPGTKEGS